MKQYRVFADMVMSYSWTVKAGSREDAIAHIQKCLEEGVVTLGDGDLSEPTTDELYEWQAVEDWWVSS